MATKKEKLLAAAKKAKVKGYAKMSVKELEAALAPEEEEEELEDELDEELDDLEDEDEDEDEEEEEEEEEEEAPPAPPAPAPAPVTPSDDGKLHLTDSPKEGTAPEGWNKPWRKVAGKWTK